MQTGKCNTNKTKKTPQNKQKTVNREDQNTIISPVSGEHFQIECCSVVGKWVYFQGCQESGVTCLQKQNSLSRKQSPIFRFGIDHSE